MVGMCKCCLRYGLVIVVMGILWKLAALALGGVILPYPEDALFVLIQAMGTQLFWEHFLVSGYRAVTAMILAWGVAFPLGLIMGSVKRVDAVLAPFIFLTYPVPKIVLLPIFLLLLGLGDTSKIAMIALILGYQILVTTRDGVRSIHPKYFDSVRSLGRHEYGRVARGPASGFFAPRVHGPAARHRRVRGRAFFRGILCHHTGAGIYDHGRVGSHGLPDHVLRHLGHVHHGRGPV